MSGDDSTIVQFSPLGVNQAAVDRLRGLPAKEDDGAVPGNPNAGHIATADELRELVETLMNSIEQLDKGLKLMIDVISGQEKRLRYLELELRKLQRKNVPAIVNQHGERAN
jgi:hypothetical protein